MMARQEGMIMRHALAAGLAGLAGILGTAAAVGEDLPDGAFGWMDELAGHCWSAVYPDGTRDTQCYTTQFGRFLRGTIEILPGPAAAASSPYRGDSVFVWNGERSEIAFHYWSSAGSSGVITGRVEGEQLIFPTPARLGGPEVRTVWTRTGPDAFRVVQQRRNGEGWADGMILTYARATAP